MPIAAPDAPAVPVFEHASAPVAVDAYASIGSQYVYRGIALRDHTTVSAAVSASASGWFVDGWAGLVDTETHTQMQYTYSTSHGTEWNIDASIGYGAPIGNNWQWSFAGARVFDVGEGNHPSEDYAEWRANLFFRDAMRAQIAYSPNYLQRGSSLWNVEIATQYPLTDVLSGQVGGGYSHGGDINDYNYGYGWIGLAGVLLQTQWDIRWIDTSGAYDPDRAGSRVVVTLSWGQHLR